MLGLQSGMIWIFWEHMPSEIPIMWEMVHPIYFLRNLNTDVKASTCLSVRSATMMTGKVSFWPRNIYHKWEGRALISNFGSSLIDGFVGRVSLFYISKSSFLGIKLYFTNPLGSLINSLYSLISSISKFIIIAASTWTSSLSSIGT